MGHLNIHMTADFEKDLNKFMKIRHISTKAEAIRIAVREGLARSLIAHKEANFSSWVGLAIQAPVNRKPQFRSDDDLWKK